MLFLRILDFFTKKQTPQPKKVVNPPRKVYTDPLERIMAHPSEWERISYYHDSARKQGLLHHQLNSRLYEDYRIKLADRRRLTFDLIPPTQSNRNVRTFLEYTTGNFSTWKQIRDDCDNNKNHVCQICGMTSKDMGKSYDTECHEVWSFTTDNNNINYQRLEKLMAVCVVCHEAKHADQHEKNEEYFDMLINHYAEINEIDIETAKEDYRIAKEHRDGINDKKYMLDMRKIKRYGNGLNMVFDPHSDLFNIWLKNHLAAKKKDEEEKASQ